MFELLEKGGIFMVPIGLCLVASLAITIERLVNLRTGRYLSNEMLDRIRTLLVNGDFDGALTTCRSKNLMFHRLLETAIVYRQLSAVDLRQLLEDQSKQELAVLERFLGFMRTIGTISPLLGLLGTVTGMIHVFEVLTEAGFYDPTSLSSGISEALITTVAGMCVAIPTIVIHSYLEGRAESIMLLMEKRMLELVLLLRSKADAA